MTIPLIIPNFNQLTYLVNLINWWNYYTKSAPVYVLDNASDYKPLLAFYDGCKSTFPNVSIVRYDENNCGKNLREFLDRLIHYSYPYYCISNPDIQPHPGTPENFLEVFRHCIDHYKFRRAGFGLIIDDIPDYMPNKQTIIQNEAGHRNDRNKVLIEYEGKRMKGYQTPIDLTFALYKTENGGWQWPLPTKEEWWSCIRIFSAYHFGWYVHFNTGIDENRNYFLTAQRASVNKKKPKGERIKGINTYGPPQAISSRGVNETITELSERMRNGKKVYYVRFGDGDIYIMHGKKDKYHKPSPALTSELRQGLQLQDRNYLKGLAVNYPVEPGMRKGLFLPHKDNSNLVKRVEQLTKEKRFYNAITFHYLSVFQPEAFNQFLDEFIRRKTKMFVGCASKEAMEKLFGTINYYVQTPERDSYDSMNTWMDDVLRNITGAEVVIGATGMATRALALRLWKMDAQVHFIDIGSIVDAADGRDTRTWIRMVKEDGIASQSLAMTVKP